jgi:hypothetical protein
MVLDSFVFNLFVDLLFLILSADIFNLTEVSFLLTAPTGSSIPIYFDVSFLDKCWSMPEGAKLVDSKNVELIVFSESRAFI